MPAISVMIKPASGQCNLSCRYCFYCDETQKRAQQSYGMMTEETLKNVIRKTMLRAEGAVSYVFQGGEPTLRGLAFFQQALAWEQHYNWRGIRVHNALQTNGTLLDEQWCRFLHDAHVLVGLSLDGTRLTHDCARVDAQGGSTYDRVLRAAALMDRFDVEYNIVTVVTQAVAAQIGEIYADYRRRGWQYQQYIACLDPLGEVHGQRPDAITPAAYGQFLITLFALWYADWKHGRQPYIRQFQNYIALLQGHRAEACDHSGVCGIQYVVEADGGVYPCDFYMLDEYRLGNFNQQRIDALDEQRQAIGFIARSRCLPEDCLRCRYAALCRGGCQRQRDLLADGAVWRNYYCQSFQIFFDACLEQLQEIAHV